MAVMGVSSGKYEYIPGRGYEPMRSFAEKFHDSFRDMRMGLGGKWEPSSFDMRSAQRSAWKSKAMEALGASPTQDVPGSDVPTPHQGDFSYGEGAVDPSGGGALAERKRRRLMGFR
ncbi:MAG: hypothetical protein ACYSW3_00190 [Planctomycetota bacterium]|jgi:hypothetical protein